jgi:hypothetical protein
VHQRHVDHRDLVHHQQIGLERMLLVALEAALAEIGLEQPVQGAGLQARGLAHWCTFRRAGAKRRSIGLPEHLP